MSPRFKLGDRVRTLSGEEVLHNDDAIGWAKHGMKGFVGEEGVITQVIVPLAADKVCYYHISVDQSRWNWSENWLVPLDSQAPEPRHPSDGLERFRLLED